MPIEEVAHAFNHPHALQDLAHAAIVPSLTNRTRFDPEAMQQLADNIKAQGVLQPILVRPLPPARLQETFTDRRKGDPLPTHEIVAGERRWRAAGMAGLPMVPVLIRDLSDEQALRMQLIENVQREDLHPLDEAAGYRRILDLPAYADQTMASRVEALAGEVKKSTRYVYVTLQLLKLCDFAQQIFREGKLLRAVALQIATIGNEAQQIEATRTIAGLGRTGTDVVDSTMAQREAADYVRRNFRLLLSKAPFPVKVEYAGIDACTGCDKMTANAPHLEEDGAKVPDTCTDPSCYGKKNAEHTKQLAEAAKAKGQRVITGKAAKKLAPWEHSPEAIAVPEFEALTDRRYGLADKANGKTIEQILGKDMPAPVLIERPDGRGFIKALPTKDVDKLLKERGLLRAPTGKTDDQRNREKKVEAEKLARWEVGQQLLAAVPRQADQDALRSQLLLPMMLQIYNRLDNDSSKRLRKLLGWEIERGGWAGGRDALTEHFKALDGTQINQFVVAAAIAGELHYAEHWHPSTEAMDSLAQLLQVDPKAIRAKLASEAKAAEQAKAAKKAPAGRKTAKTPAPAAAKAPTKKAGNAKGKPEIQLGLDVEGTTGPAPNPAAQAWPFPRPKKEVLAGELAKAETSGNKYRQRSLRNKIEQQGEAGGKKEDLAGEIELTSGVTLSPQPAWPFPTASKVERKTAEAKT